MRSSIARAGVAAVVLLELAGLALYAGTLRHGPVWDDHFFVFGQDFLERCGNLALVLDPRSFYRVLPVANSARPAWLASILVDACLSHGQPLGYRLTSIFWHSCGAACLLALVWRLSSRRETALAAALLFLAHPLHTEPVNILSFRGELMAFALMTLALLVFLDARERPARGRRLWTAASLLCFALALLSKESAATLPLLIILADRLFPAPGRRARWASYAPYFAVLLLYLAFRAPRSGYVMEGHEDALSALRDEFPKVSSLVSQPPEAAPPPRAKMEPPPWSEEVLARPSVRFLTMSRVLGSYARLLVWPHPLQGDYAPRPVSSWLDGRVWLSWLTWLALFAAAWKLRRREPLACFALLWIPLTLLPFSGLVALKNLEAERYLYIPSAGVCVAAAAAFSRARRAPRLAAASAVTMGVVLTTLCVLTWRRNRDYRDDLAFYQATDAVDDGVPRVHFNLAQSYRYLGRLDLAEAEFRAGLRLWPKALKGRLQYADLLASEGRSPEAAALVDAAERDYPGNRLIEEARAEEHLIRSRR